MVVVVVVVVVVCVSGGGWVGNCVQLHNIPLQTVSLRERLRRLRSHFIYHIQIPPPPSFSLTLATTQLRREKKWMKKWRR